MKSQKSKTITDLNASTKYQVRVRHSSARRGSTEVYDESSWSKSVTFTTGADAGGEVIEGDDAVSVRELNTPTGLKIE